MCGLQGAGKTTTTAKIARKLKKKGRKPLLVACDVYRPAAIDQLKINGEKQDVEVFAMGTNHKPVDIAKAAMEHASKNGLNVVILDTAGRLHVDEDMMAELQEIQAGVAIDQKILVVDAMTGQDAVNVASTFNEKIGIDGVILTKLDGDTQVVLHFLSRQLPGVRSYLLVWARSFRIWNSFIRIYGIAGWGMGDVLTLIEKAEAEIDQDKAKEMEKICVLEFDFNDFGSVSPDEEDGYLLFEYVRYHDLNIDDDVFKSTEAILYSMTREERGNPAIINPSRKRRIAKGAGADISEVNKLIKQFEQSKKMMKQMSGMMGGKGKRRRGGMPKLPFGF